MIRGHQAATAGVIRLGTGVTNARAEAANTHPLTCQLDEIGQVVASSHVCACVGRFTAHIRDAGGQSLEAILSTRRAQLSRRVQRAAVQSPRRCRCLRP